VRDEDPRTRDREDRGHRGYAVLHKQQGAKTPTL
jgi:hypothetical protein